MTFYDRQEEKLLKDFQDKLAALEDFYHKSYNNQIKNKADIYLSLYKDYVTLSGKKTVLDKKAEVLKSALENNLKDLYNTLEASEKASVGKHLGFLKKKKQANVVDLEETKCIRDVDKALFNLHSFYDYTYKAVRKRKISIRNALYNSNIMKKKVTFVTQIKQKIDDLKKMKYVR